jgi:hypothetical protein
MAFTGTPVFEQVSDSIVRITGLSLTTTGVGVIGLHGATTPTGVVALPESFKPVPYTYNGDQVSLAACITCEAIPVAATSTAAVSVAKSGTTLADYRMSLASTTGSTTAGLDIYVRFHT